MDTHSAILTDENGIAIAFVDGIADACGHQWDGEIIYFNNDGEYFRGRDMPDSRLMTGKTSTGLSRKNGCPALASPALNAASPMSLIFLWNDI